MHALETIIARNERAQSKHDQRPLDLGSTIIAYEQGELDGDATVELFQGLIDSGLVWQLQGHYGRTATTLIAAGYCHRKR